MRLATWNLNHGGRDGRDLEAQLAVLADMAADVTVLIEVPAEISTATARRVVSPRQRVNGARLESWVAITGDDVVPVDIDIPFERMAVAALAHVGGHDVVVYGSVLPWLAAIVQAPAHVLSGESSEQMFLRVLGEQVHDVARLVALYPETIVVWGGDFNQTLSGPNWGGSAVRRRALIEGLDELGFVAWNGDASHFRGGMVTIDLICGPKSVEHQRSVMVPSELSDHAAYSVDID